jgi:heme-degrading monooxygenase HmoA
MKQTDPVLLTAIYHPKPGYEEDFINLWNTKIKKLALTSGATWASIYHNEETEEFLSTSHWSEKTKAEKFLEHPKYHKALKELNKLSLIPPSRAVYDFLREAA